MGVFSPVQFCECPNNGSIRIPETFEYTQEKNYSGFPMVVTIYFPFWFFNSNTSLDHINIIFFCYSRKVQTSLDHFIFKIFFSVL
jgi:hypothetical protein